MARTQTIDNQIYRLIIPHKKILKAYEQIARSMIEKFDFINNHPVMIGILPDGFFTLNGLCRIFTKLGVEYSIDFMTLNRDKKNIQIIGHETCNLAERYVILIKAISSSGETFGIIKQIINGQAEKKYNPLAVYSYSLCWRPGRYNPEKLLPTSLDFQSFPVKSSWLIGEGLGDDYKEGTHRDSKRGIEGIWSL